MEELEKDPHIAQKIKGFRNKQAQMKPIFTDPDEDLFNPDYIEIDRILEVAHTKDAETGEVGVLPLSFHKACCFFPHIMSHQQMVCFNGIHAFSCRMGFQGLTENG